MKFSIKDFFSKCDQIRKILLTELVIMSTNFKSYSYLHVQMVYLQ